MNVMTLRGAAWLAWLPVLALAGCGSGGSAKTDGGATAHDADFSVCSGTPAVPYAPGMSAPSASGAYLATVQTAVTVDSTGASTATAAVGKATFTVAVSAGADAGAADGLTMSIPPSPSAVPADPYMPVHKHGGSFSPTVTSQGAGLFTVADIDFFMGGYWQLYLDLLPAGATAADRVTFEICIPND